MYQEFIPILAIIIAAASLLGFFLMIRRVKTQISEMSEALADVNAGNGNRRILSSAHELTAPLAYEMNDIILSYESRLSAYRQMEETNILTYFSTGLS